MHLSADSDTWHHSAPSLLPWVWFVHSNITIIHSSQCRNPQHALLIHSAWRCPLHSYSCFILHYGFWLSFSFKTAKPPTESRTWVKLLDLSGTPLWDHLLCLPSTAGPDCPASQRNTVNRGNPAPQWTMVETPGVPLSVYLGYSMRWLHQEELTWFRNLIWEKPKALETWSWKSAAAWELGRRTENFKVFVEQRQVLRTWNNTDELHWGKCFSTTFLFRDWEDWSGCWEHRDRARMPGHQLCPQHGWRSYHSSLQSPGRGDGHSHHNCRLVSSLGPSKLSHSRARGAWGQCNPRKLLNSIMVSLHLWETKSNELE